MARFYNNAPYNTTHYTSIVDPNQIGDTSNLTVSAWVFSVRVGGDGQGIVAYGNGVNGARRGWTFRIDGFGRPQLRWNTDAVTTMASGSGVRYLPRGVWCHVCARVQTRVASKYIDGYNIGGGASFDFLSPQDSTDDLIIGSTFPSDGSGTTAFNGAIAEVAVWNSALSLDQIQALASGANARSIDPTNLKFYVPLTDHIVRDEILNVTATETGRPMPYADRWQAAPFFGVESIASAAAVFRRSASGLGTRAGNRPLFGV